MKTTSPYLNLRSAAAYTDISADTLKRAIRAGALPAKLTSAGGGGRFLIRREDLDAWFDQLEDA